MAWLLGCAALPLPAAELRSINGATLVESEFNDGDSFVVRASGREMHVRLYYVDCPETDYKSDSGLQRMQDQQFHFGLPDIPTVLDFGAQAAAYTQRILAHPFTLHTSYANAPGRSAGGRIYAFVESHDGQDLGHLLVAAGLARILGKTRPAPDGAASAVVLENLQDLRSKAMLQRTGVWRASDPELLVEQRRALRQEARARKEWRDDIAREIRQQEQPFDLNSASSRQLQSIPGIGPVLAQAIISGRPYKHVRELRKISGIGARRLAAIKSYVTLREQATPE